MHLDDYFYPYPVAGQTFDDDEAYDAVRRRTSRTGPPGDATTSTGWCARPRPASRRSGPAPVRHQPLRGVAQRRAPTRSARTRAAGVQTYDDLYADTRKWVREGWIDYIVPQLYWNIGFAAADYAKLLPWWARGARGTGTRRCTSARRCTRRATRRSPRAWQDPAELSRHLTLAEGTREVRGHVFFSAREVAEDPIGAMARVVADHYRQPARTPRGLARRSSRAGG